MPPEQNPPTLTPLAPDQSNPPPDKPVDQKPTDQKPADQKPADQKPADQKPADKPGETLLGQKPPEAPAGAPEKYEPWKLPDGLKLSDETSTALNTLFKEANISQETGQKLVDLHTKAIAAVTNSHTEAWETTRKTWADEIKADKDIGSGKDDNPLKPEVGARIAKLIDAHLGGDEFRTVLAVTGAGNNPGMARALNKVATLLEEGGHVEGQPAKPDPKNRTAAQRMYPHLAEQKG